jgi:hypothetical protein
MLEQRVLLLLPACDSATRAIVSADSGAPQGFAQWRPRKGAWWRLRPAVLAVHEDEDAPLLFTVRRWLALLPWREVRDAEGRRIGFLFGKWLSNRLGRRLARVERLDEGAYAFRQPNGRLLGEVRLGPEGARLTFASEVEHEPFVKMLLLAAALALPAG